MKINIIVRYFFWVLMSHLLTFYKQRPINFIVGLVLWPYHVVDRFFYPPELHKEMVANGLEAIRSYWQIEGAVIPPTFVRNRFEALSREVL